jgi:hypothetical protein
LPTRAGHLEVVQEAVLQDLEVQLAHARDDHLAGLVVHPVVEGRVVLGEQLERDLQLVLLLRAARLDRHGDDRLGKTIPSSRIGCALVQSVSPV